MRKSRAGARDFHPAHEPPLRVRAGQVEAHARGEGDGRPPRVRAVDDRLTAVRTLLAEETSVSMLIGVAVGYELAHELMRTEG